MKLQKVQKLLVSVLTVMAVCMPAPAQKSKSKPVVTAASKARCEIIAKELEEYEARLRAGRRAIEKSDEIIALRKAASDAEAAYQKGKTTDRAVLAAKEAIRDADREYHELLAKIIKSSPAGVALRKEQVALDNKRAACNLQLVIANIKLTHDDSPIVRALASDPILAQYKKAYYDAEGAARAEAKTEYEKLRAAALNDMFSVQQLRAEIKTATAGKAEAEKALEVIEDKLDKIEAAAAKSDDPELAAAKAKETAAQAAYQKAYYGGTMQALRDKREQSRAAIYAAIREAIAEDPVLAALSNKIHQLGIEYKKLGGRKRSKSSRK